MSRHQGKPSLNSRDPNNPFVHWFSHEGEKRSVDYGSLMDLAKKYAFQRKRPDLAEDFSQWCVVHNLERIENGSTHYAHLNKCSWLWSEYLEENFGAKSRSGPKWERASMTLSYDNPVKDGGEGTFLDFVQTNELNPEERLLLKEDLSKCSEEQVEEALFNNRAARKQNDRLVYDYFVRLCKDTEMAKYKPAHVARDLNLTAMEVSRAVSRLVQRKVLSKKEKVVRLQNPIDGKPRKSAA